MMGIPTEIVHHGQPRTVHNPIDVMPAITIVDGITSRYAIRRLRVRWT
jgi:hypothetical protein